MKNIFIITLYLSVIFYGNNSNLFSQETDEKKDKIVKTFYRFADDKQRKLMIVGETEEYLVIGLINSNDIKSTPLYLVKLKSTKEVEDVVAYTYVGTTHPYAKDVLMEDIKVTLLDFSKLSKKERKKRFKQKNKYAVQFIHKKREEESFTTALDFEEILVN